MHFQFLQSISVNGTPDRPNDDRVGATVDLAWVIDGATDLGEPGLLGTTGGAAWLSATAQTALQIVAGSTVRETMGRATQAIAHAFDRDRTRDIAAPWETPKAACAVAQIVDATLDCAQCADCSILVIRENDLVWATAAPDTQDEASAAAALGAGSAPTLQGEVLEDRRAARSVPDHAALSPDAERSMAATTFTSCPIAPGDEVLLMSDGFSAAIADYAHHTAETLVDTIKRDGLHRVVAQIRDIEDRDAECATFPRFKKSDDCTALWLRVSA